MDLNFNIADLRVLVNTVKDPLIKEECAEALIEAYEELSMGRDKEAQECIHFVRRNLQELNIL